MYGNLPKSGTVNLTAPNTGMVQGITSLEDKGLRVNAGDTVEIIISDIVLDNEVVVPEPKTNTLTLDGAGWADAVVYSVDGKTDYPTTKETEFGQVVALTAEIPADVEEVVVVLKDGTQINVPMTGDVILDENDLGVATGDKFTVTVDGKVVKYVDKGDASATDYNVTGVGTSFKMQYAGATTYWSYSTPVNNASLIGDIEIETGYVTVSGTTAADVSGYATYNGANYIKANTGVLTFTKAGTYSINGEVRENVSVGDTYTVGDKDVVIDTYQTAEELDEAVETAWAGIVATGKGPDYVSGGTMDIDLTTNTIAIEVNNGAAIKDTGLVALASALLGDGCTIVVSNGNDSVTLSGSVDPTDDVAALKGLLPTTAGIERTLTVVVTNADDQSVTYTVTYKQN